MDSEQKRRGSSTEVVVWMELNSDREFDISEICRDLNMSRSVAQRAIAQARRMNINGAKDHCIVYKAGCKYFWHSRASHSQPVSRSSFHLIEESTRQMLLSTGKSSNQAQRAARRNSSPQGGMVPASTSQRPVQPPVGGSKPPSRNETDTKYYESIGFNSAGETIVRAEDGKLYKLVNL